ncbi:MAG: hypothetical protein CL862_04680 [Cyanobium sp. NAT70]|nr:hypothetical protein [Cyanobium sp. NAT70]
MLDHNQSAQIGPKNLIHKIFPIQIKASFPFIPGWSKNHFTTKTLKENNLISFKDFGFPIPANWIDLDIEQQKKRAALQDIHRCCPQSPCLERIFS